MAVISKKFFVVITAILVLSSFASGCGNYAGAVSSEISPNATQSTTPLTEPPKQAEPTTPPTESALIPSGNIYLYGEHHGVEKILQKELEIWGNFYSDGLRHLFVELPYFSGEFLNIWMKADNDDILEDLYNDLGGTAAYSPVWKEFYKTIKSEYPETVFHGTDVGQMYLSAGARFLRYLKENGETDSQRYAWATEVIEQGKICYRNSNPDDVYRENTMTQNFIREFDALAGESIVRLRKKPTYFLQNSPMSVIIRVIERFAVGGAENGIQAGRESGADDT